MNILALDTATEACSAALLAGDALQTEYVETPRDHSRLILKMIDTLMAAVDIVPAQLDGIAFGRGPGSFTGVRIGAGVVQGIALAVNCPVVPISSLAAIAQRTHREIGAEYVLAAIDARMSDVYWGAFQLDSQGLMQACIDEMVTSPHNVVAPEQSGEHRWTGAGTGWCTYPEALASAVPTLAIESTHHQLPHAQDILTLAQRELAEGKGVLAEFAQPVYLRDKVAQTLAERHKSGC